MKYLNEFPIKETGNVFKYQKAEVANLCLSLNEQKGTLKFSRPSEWKDPTERAFYEAKISPENVVNASKVYACCISKEALSEAAWITYQYGTNDGSVKFSIKFDEFLNQIDSWAREHQYELYIGETIYDEWQVINKIGQPDFKYKSKIFVADASPLETFLRSLLLKRKAFEYEKEIRLFLVNEGTEDKGQSILVEVDWKDCLNDTIYFSEDCRVCTKEILEKKAADIGKKIEKSNLYKKQTMIEYNIVSNETNQF